MNDIRTAPTLLADDGRGTLASRLKERLLALDYSDFARCLCALLETLGYEDARPAGRNEWKGYNRPGGGGYDLEAVLPGGFVPRRIVAQIKQFDGLHVHQRNVDELRGACLRAQASEALLVTTSAFSEVVRKAAASPEPAGGLIAPVRLIDGDELLALMIRHRVGVCEHDQSGERSLEIDEAFFRDMAGLHGMTDLNTMPGQGMRSRKQCSRPTLSGWQVTLQILPQPRPHARQPRPPARRRGQGKGGR